MSLFSVNLVPWRQWQRRRQCRRQATCNIGIVIFSVVVTLAVRQRIQQQVQALQTDTQQASQQLLLITRQAREAEVQLRYEQAQYAKSQAVDQRRQTIQTLADRLKAAAAALPGQVWFLRIESTVTQLVINGQTRSFSQLQQWQQRMAMTPGIIPRLTHLEHVAHDVSRFTLSWGGINDRKEQ